MHSLIDNAFKEKLKQEAIDIIKDTIESGKKSNKDIFKEVA